MEVKVDHKYSKEEALVKMKSFFEELKKQHGDKVSDLSEKWVDNSGDYACKFNGMQLNGHIDVLDNQVVFNGKIPFFATPFKSLIESTIRSEVEKVLK
ncbi:MAG: polyhydroxyalkanoic acid system family protein [Bacteroidales bacterium]|nr:polyhydroxyalkanoic acid system family protein [Bacteroidales bacterium]